MTDRELDEIFKNTKSKVTVCCNEYHGHNALNGCLISTSEPRDERDVIICKLVEVIKHERATLRAVVEGYK